MFHVCVWERAPKSNPSHISPKLILTRLHPIQYLYVYIHVYICIYRMLQASSPTSTPTRPSSTTARRDAVWIALQEFLKRGPGGASRS